MFAKQFTLSFSSADMNYIYFFVYALYTVTKRSRKQDHSTVSKTHKVSQWVSYPKRGTNSNHGSNNFRRQGASYLKHPEHFFAPGPGPRPTEETSIKIQSTQSSSGRAHKVAHDQLGSQVGLPFPPSIPCMAGRLKNYVHKWHTIISDQ